MIRNITALLIIGLCAAPAITLADSLPIESGLWSMTSTTTNPFTGTQTDTSQECVKEDEFNPKTFLKDMEGCELTNNKVSGNQLDFTMQCNIQGMVGTVNGAFISDGDQASGQTVISVNMGGQSMQIQTEFSGNRIGDC